VTPEGRARLVLVVDDDVMIRRLVRAVLETDEFEVTEARDGPAALRLADETDPAVVVLDVMMPGIDGVEVCRQLDHEKMKVVVLTAQDDPSLESEAKAAGANAFITKPFSAIELLDLVAELMPA